MTDPTTGFTYQFTVGFAQALANAGLGLSWQPSGAYPAGTTGIFVGALPQPGPDACVVLTPNTISDDPTLAQSVMGLQIRTRGTAQDQAGVWLLDDAIAGHLLGLFPTALPTGIQISILERRSSAPLGQDDAGRWIYSSRYAANLHRPTAHRG